MSPETSAVMAEAERREKAARQRGRDEALLAMMRLLFSLPHAGGQALAVELQNAVCNLEKL